MLVRGLGTRHSQTWLVMVGIQIGTATEDNLAIFISKIHFVYYAPQKHLHVCRWWLIVFVIEKCSQGISQAAFLSEALGPLPNTPRVHFLEAVGLRSPFSCWLSAGGRSPFWMVHTAPFHMAPSPHDSMLLQGQQENLSSRRIC